MYNLHDLKQSIHTVVRNNIESWQQLNLRRFFYLFHISSNKEKRLLIFILFLLLASGIGLLLRVYFGLSEPIPSRGGIYTEGLLREPQTINPLFLSQDTDRDISRLVFSRLLTYSGNGTIEPDLAEKYEISSDGKTYTLTLRPNTYWQDGEPLGADDIVFTIKTIQNPRYKSVMRANWQGVAVQKMDDRTVRFTLRIPYAPFIENLTVGILPRHLWEGVDPDQAPLNKLNLQPIGSGPYQFNSLIQTKDGSILSYELVRNPRYYGTTPYLDKIIFKFFKSTDEIVGALHKGLIDGFGAAPAEKLIELDPQKNSVVDILMPRIFGLFFNEKKSPILSSIIVRQAIAMALDRTQIAQKATSGGAIPMDSPIPLFRPDPQDKDPMMTYDPAKAREILESDGWKDLDGNGILEKKTREHGKTILTPLHIVLSTSDWPDLVHTADLIQVMLKRIGMDVSIQKLPLSDLETSVIKPRNFEILLFGQVYGYEPDPFTFWHSSQIKDPGLNVALYTNKKADRILEQTRSVADPALREKKYREFSHILAKDLPAVFLYSQLYLYLLPSNLHGVDINKISLPSDRFNTITNWYRETGRKFKSPFSK